MAITPLTTPVAQRTDPEAVFIVRADVLAAELPVMVDEINVEIININERSDQVAEDTIAVTIAKDAALAASNFKGAWADLTGALTLPAAVTHSGAIWLLLEDLADVTASEPSGGNTDWFLYDFVSQAVFNARTITAGTGLQGGGTLAANRTFNVDVATAANLRAGAVNKILDAASVYAANAPVTLTDGATITPNLDAGWVFKVTLGGNRTLANPTNQSPGQSGDIIVRQDGTGGRTLSFGSHWNFAGGTPGVSSAPNAIDVISYRVEASGTIIATLTRGFA